MDVWTVEHIIDLIYEQDLASEVLQKLQEDLAEEGHEGGE